MGVIETEKNLHGIALLHALGKGYRSNGTLHNILVFDLAKNTTIKYSLTGKFADAIFYVIFQTK
ncbi:MAG: hypothetical protein ABIU77_28365 [Ferruginibacter sp.]